MKDAPKPLSRKEALSRTKFEALSKGLDDVLKAFQTDQPGWFKGYFCHLILDSLRQAKAAAEAGPIKSHHAWNFHVPFGWAAENGPFLKKADFEPEDFDNEAKLLGKARRFLDDFLRAAVFQELTHGTVRLFWPAGKDHYFLVHPKAKKSRLATMPPEEQQKLIAKLDQPFSLETQFFTIKIEPLHALADIRQAFHAVTVDLSFFEAGGEIAIDQLSQQDQENWIRFWQDLFGHLEKLASEFLDKDYHPVAGFLDDIRAINAVGTLTMQRILDLWNQILRSQNLQLVKMPFRVGIDNEAYLERLEGYGHSLIGHELNPRAPTFEEAEKECLWNRASLTQREAAFLANVTTRTIRNWRKAKDISKNKQGRILTESLRNHIKKQRTS